MRNGIDIKGRVAEVPFTIEQVYWWQYKAIIEKEIELGRVLKHVELVICFLGEDEEYWRSGQDVNLIIQLTVLLFEIYQKIKERTGRDSIKEVIISELLKLPRHRRRSWLKKNLKGDKLPLSIEMDEKTYDAPSMLEWKENGQWIDSLEVSKVIHSKTEPIHYLEAQERLFKIYFYPIVSGENYTVEGAMDFDVSRARYVDVVDFGGFFLMKCNGLLNGTKKIQPKLNTLTKNSGPVLMKSGSGTSSRH